MATTTTRVKDIPTTATSEAADDYYLMDGATNGTRKLAAANAAKGAIATHNGDAAAHGLVAWRPAAASITGATMKAQTPNYTALTARTLHKTLSATRSIRLAFLGTYQTGSVETPIGNHFELKASIETVGGLSIPVYFQGKRLVLLKPSHLLISDPVVVDFDADVTFYARVFQNKLASSSYASSGEAGLLSTTQTSLYYNYFTRGVSAINNDGEQYAASASTGIDPFTVDLTDSTGTAGLSNSGSLQCLRPIILGSGIEESVCVIGTSIDYGSGDQYAGYVAGAGYVSRACNSLNIPSVNIGIQGSSYRIGWLPQGRMNPRGNLLDFCDVVTIGGPTNDIGLGDSIETIKANVTKLANRIKDAGKRVVMITAFPQSSSTDGWTTIGNQTVLSGAVRNAYNAWLLNTPPSSCDLVIDAAQAVRDQTGAWSAGEMVASGTVSTTSTSYLEDTGANFAANALAGYVVRNVTAGTTAVILYNTATRVYGSSNGFTAGDSYQIWRQPTYDGTHPSGYGHSLAATVVQNALHAFL